ncbi:MAG TPA: PAS domain S-box protein [Gaiellaceae bacterium]|nr:PAS domain S-box protein [Gaiellaceae bacterium]
MSVQVPVPRLAPFQQDLVQETLLGEALEHAPVGAIVLDEEGRYLAVNRRACELAGYTREELLDGGAKAIAFEPQLLPDTVAHMAGGYLRPGVTRLKRKDGTPVTCEYQLGATRSGGLPFFVVVFWEQGETAR